MIPLLYLFFDGDQIRTINMVCLPDDRPEILVIDRIASWSVFVLQVSFVMLYTYQFYKVNVQLDKFFKELNDDTYPYRMNLSLLIIFFIFGTISRNPVCFPLNFHLKSSNIHEASMCWKAVVFCEKPKLTEHPLRFPLNFHWESGTKFGPNFTRAFFIRLTEVGGLKN